MYWKTPYLDRLVYTLGKFLRHGIDEKQYIIDAHAHGIKWRGDDMITFKALCKTAGFQSDLLDDLDNEQKGGIK